MMIMNIVILSHSTSSVVIITSKHFCCACYKKNARTFQWSMVKAKVKS